MRSREIPRKEWQNFVEELSLEREGWIATVERVGTENPRTADLSEHSLDAINVELEESPERIRIELGDQASISIDSPVRISVAETEEQQDEIVEFEAPTGTVRMHLRFPRASVPDETGEEIGLPSDNAGLEAPAPGAVEDALRIKGG